jgi:hypothetical protein
MLNDPLMSLVSSWLTEAERFDAVGCEGHAKLARAYAQELEAWVEGLAEQVVTLQEASTLSGYSKDHLGRMTRDGKLVNRGQKGAPRIRRGDLPTKSPLSDRAQPPHVLAEQIVQSVINQGIDDGSHE